MFDVVIPLGKDQDNYTCSINSALRQSNVACVYVVINGRFPENKCDELIGIFQKKISERKLKVIVDYTLQNGNQARNLGISSGSAEWVAFLDSDDTWDEGWLDHVSKKIGDHPGVEMFYGSVCRVRSEGKEEVLSAADWKQYRTPENYIMSGGCSQSSALIARRTLLRVTRWRPLVTRRQDRFFFIDAVRQGAVVEPIKTPFVRVYRDSGVRYFREADILDFLQEIRGRVPFKSFLSFSRGFFVKPVRKPVLLMRLIAVILTTKHLDWYLRK